MDPLINEIINGLLLLPFKMDLISILGINEVEQKLKTQFNLYISWFDFRLKILNMKTNFNLNTLTQEEKGSIWVPVLVFRIVIILKLFWNLNYPICSNTEEKDTTLNDEKSFAVAQRLADFEYSDESVKDNIYVFEGSENPFVMSRVYEVNWICEYDMRK